MSLNAQVDIDLRCVDVNINEPQHYVLKAECLRPIAPTVCICDNGQAQVYLLKIECVTHTHKYGGFMVPFYLSVYAPVIKHTTCCKQDTNLTLLRICLTHQHGHHYTMLEIYSLFDMDIVSLFSDR